MSSRLTAGLFREIERLLGPGGVIADPDRMGTYLSESRGLYRGAAELILLPATTAAASAAVSLCAREGISMVPQGGNTGLVGGAVAQSSASRPEVVLSAQRLNRIRHVDTAGDTITAEAGCVLAQLQAAAEQSDRLFPLSLAAEGSCQLGGNLSTNAGGTAVLRYGSARDLVLGLEVVLPDGRVFDGLRGLRKDNAGYSLRELFLGAEGTLGFITAATCRLFPRPRGSATAFVAVPDPDSALALLAAAREAIGDRLSAFELLSRFALDLALQTLPGSRDPLDRAHPWYLLVEASGPDSAAEIERRLTEFLATQMERGIVEDGSTASSEAQRQAFWNLRHHVSDAQKRIGASIKNDVAVPVASVPSLIRDASARVLEIVPAARIVAFGHVGDGNIHFNVSQPADMDAAAFLQLWQPVTAAVNDVVAALGGTFSAEHGIGLLKTAELERYRGGVELDLMRRIKRALDPANLMNPGKVVGNWDR
ncbi:MAG: FAD-binding oxidoreductase [Gammaproteobacteria bacterium]|nr:FAD-binding oxidoreductase [Gammaproteobacteria bacterium]